MTHMCDPILCYIILYNNSCVQIFFSNFRMKLLLLSYAIALLCQSSLNSSHNFVFFSLFVPLLILNFDSSESLFDLIAFNHDPLQRSTRAGLPESRAGLGQAGLRKKK